MNDLTDDTIREWRTAFDGAQEFMHEEGVALCDALLAARAKAEYWAAMRGAPWETRYRRLEEAARDVVAKYDMGRGFFDLLSSDAWATLRAVLAEEADQ